jgi:hypothetical protein
MSRAFSCFSSLSLLVSSVLSPPLAVPASVGSFGGAALLGRLGDGLVLNLLRSANPKRIEPS